LDVYAYIWCAALLWIVLVALDVLVVGLLVVFR